MIGPSNAQMDNFLALGVLHPGYKHVVSGHRTDCFLSVLILAQSVSPESRLPTSLVTSLDLQPCQSILEQYRLSTSSIRFSPPQNNCIWTPTSYTTQHIQ